MGAIVKIDVGGGDAADLLFQLAIEDPKDQKDWVSISQKVGTISPKDAEMWFENITKVAFTPYSFWTEKEDSILKSLILPKPILSFEEICKVFQKRTEKSVRLRMQKLIKTEHQKVAENKMDDNSVSEEMPKAAKIRKNIVITDLNKK